MGDDKRWDNPPGQEWGDRYRRADREARFDRDERRYGAGDFEASQNPEPRQGADPAWRPYEPGQAGPEYRDRGGDARGWERTASGQGHGDRPVFSGWDAPFGGRPVRHEEHAGDGWSRVRDEGRSFLDRTREELSTLFGGARREDDYRARRDGDFRGIGPKGYRRSDERIREDVHDRLTEDSWLDASGVEVTVHGGEVTLDGTVRSRADKRRAEDLIEHVSGVGHVQNNLRAADGEKPGKTEHPPSAPLI